MNEMDKILIELGQNALKGAENTGINSNSSSLSLSDIIKNQKLLIDDFNNSHGYENIDALQKDIETVDKQIDNTELAIKRSQEILQEIIEKNPFQRIDKKDEKVVDKETVNAAIKDIISDIQNQVRGLIKMTTDNEIFEVPITAVYDIEQQMISIKEHLTDRGLYPQLYDNEEKLEKHNRKVMKFVSSVVHGNDPDSQYDYSSDSSDDYF